MDEQENKRRFRALRQRNLKYEVFDPYREQQVGRESSETPGKASQPTPMHNSPVQSPLEPPAKSRATGIVAPSQSASMQPAQDSQRQQRKRGRNDDLYEFVIGAYLAPKYNVLTRTGEIEPMGGKQLNIRLIHQLVSVVYPERAISYGTVRAMIAKGRENNPAVFSLAGCGAPHLRRPLKVSGAPVSLQTHEAAWRAFKEKIARELARLQAVFYDTIHDLERGTLVLRLETLAWEWHP